MPQFLLQASCNLAQFDGIEMIQRSEPQAHACSYILALRCSQSQIDSSPPGIMDHVYLWSVGQFLEAGTPAGNVMGLI